MRIPPLDSLAIWKDPLEFVLEVVRLPELLLIVTRAAASIAAASAMGAKKLSAKRKRGHHDPRERENGLRAKLEGYVFIVWGEDVFGAEKIRTNDLCLWQCGPTS